MKKVLFISSLYYPHIGGIETMIDGLADFYGKQGIDSVVLTKKWPSTLTEEDELKNTKIYRVVSARSKEDFFNVIDWIKNNEEKIRADIIHVVGVRRPLPLIGLLLSHHWNVPLVSTVAGGEIPHEGDLDTYGVWDEGKDIMKPVLELSNVVTCVSKSLVKDLQKIIPGHNDIRTIYAGLDIDSIKNVVCTEKENHYILSLRRLVASKGIDVLIRAFKEVNKQYPNVKLLIAGEGQEEPNLRSIVKTLNLESSVDFLGSVSFDRGVSLLKGAICTVVPSISEGGGLVNVEAQAAFCPVVASRVGGIPEYVKDCESGLLFEPGDYKELSEKIIILMSNEILRNKLIQGGLEHAKNFSWNVLGPQYLDLYKEMLSVKSVNPFSAWSNITKNLWLRLKK